MFVVKKSAWGNVQCRTSQISITRQRHMVQLSVRGFSTYLQRLWEQRPPLIVLLKYPATLEQKRCKLILTAMASPSRTSEYCVALFFGRRCNE